jgi:hypothetical protein
LLSVSCLVARGETIERDKPTNSVSDIAVVGNLSDARRERKALKAHHLVWIEPRKQTHIRGLRHQCSSYILARFTTLVQSFSIFDNSC